MNLIILSSRVKKYLKEKLKRQKNFKKKDRGIIGILLFQIQSHKVLYLQGDH
jgi:hypothetical protein